MDRVRSEDVPTVDATLAAHGAVGRPAIELPATAVARAGEADASDAGAAVERLSDAPTVPVDEVVRLVLDGATRHARFESFAGSVRATGAYDAPDLARSPGDGTNRLREWVDGRDLATGRTVHLDAVEPGFAYGLRAPGETAVYDAPGRPDDSLAAIARDLDGEE